MPSRKQRRRRAKERRHEYEFVYVDAEGEEVEVDASEAEEAPSRTNGKRDAKPKRQPAKGKQQRPARVVEPPSWRKTGRRALIFFPLIFVAFSFINSKQPIATRLLVTLLYTGFFIPFMYLMDRAMYRAYLRRTGQTPQPRSSRRS